MDTQTIFPELVQDSRLEVTFDASPCKPIKTTHRKPSGRRLLYYETWTRERRLGKGGYGTVWLERNNMDQFRAVKELRVLRQEGKGASYVRELEALAKFSQEKFARFFVKFYGWFEASEMLFIAMEYYEDGDLENYLTDHGRLPEEQVQDITWQVLQGLLFMHENNFAHRDLKPANILIKTKPPGDDWQVKICDLGLSKRIGGDMAFSTVQGTFGFMPPELLGVGGNPRNADPFAVDIWCLGETAFRLLTSHGTFETYTKMLEYAKGMSQFPHDPLERFGASNVAVEFLKMLMVVAPTKRLTARQANKHDWMVGGIEVPEAPLDHGRIGSGSISSQTKALALYQNESDEASGEWTETGPVQASSTLKPQRINHPFFEGPRFTSHSDTRVHMPLETSTIQASALISQSAKFPSLKPAHHVNLSIGVKANLGNHPSEVTKNADEDGDLDSKISNDGSLVVEAKEPSILAKVTSAAKVNRQGPNSTTISIQHAPHTRNKRRHFPPTLDRWLNDRDDDLFVRISLRDTQYRPMLLAEVDTLVKRILLRS